MQNYKHKQMNKIGFISTNMFTIERFKNVLILKFIDMIKAIIFQQNFKARFTQNASLI